MFVFQHRLLPLSTANKAEGITDCMTAEKGPMRFSRSMILRIEGLTHIHVTGTESQRYRRPDCPHIRIS